ncbi:dienelactone hydrolase family protein [Shewanella morhuae]|uniref:dienelactone hydrolase family protein n=1 Tax=Shewanella morhuae TaxID=365591 RepID=UPI001BBA4255|nr:dienelactone hydrolase family protein [Shewanella morhuae]GIU07687.1 dienelactone hydrolase [Shewanella morhuae]
MKILILTDIFGVTADIIRLVGSINNEHVIVEIVDPYDGEIKCFVNEHSAYETFLKECGHERYFDKIHYAVSSSVEDLVIIGFSAGASAAWRVMDCCFKAAPLHFIGFYPGQIRNHLNVIPQYPCTLIFPNHEEHFNVSQVSDVLSKVDKVYCINTEFGHGFMNPLSAHYSSRGADAFNAVINQISQLTDVTMLRRLLQR